MATPITPRWPARILAIVAFGLLAGSAHAQESAEDRLREALRRTTADLRDLQDSQAQRQAALDQAVQQRDTLQNQVYQLQQQVTDLEAQAAQPAEPAAPQIDVEAVQAQLDALQRDGDAARAAVAQWQTAYQQAAGVAQQKENERSVTAQQLGRSRQAIAACSDANGKLEALGNEILHLYETQSFRNLVLASYEPVLGYKRVELENLVQGYEDKIYDAGLPANFEQQLPQAPPAGTPPAAGSR